MKRLFRLFSALSFGAIILVGCGEASRTVEEHMDAAVAFRGQGEDDAAVLELKAAIKKAPDDHSARWLLGTIYLSQGESAAAAKELERSMELGHDPGEVVIPLAEALLQERRYGAVLDQTEGLGNLAGEDQVRLWVLRGHAQKGLNAYNEADELYDRALALSSDDAEAMLGKAEIQARQNSFDEARDWITLSLESDPSLSRAWSLLGEIEQLSGDLKAAENAFSKAIEVNPEGVHELASRGIVRLSMGKVGQAASDINMAWRLNNLKPLKQPLVYYAAGLLALENDNYERAAQALEEMLQFEPNYLPARYYLATAHYRMGNLEQADQGATFVLERTPNFVGAHRLYAAVKLAQRDYVEARQVLENILSFVPDDHWSRSMLADIGVLEGSPEDALENYHRLVELYPESEKAHRNLALGLMMVDPEKSREVVLERIEESGASVETSTLVMLSFVRSGKWDEAIAAGRDLVAMDRDNWDAHTLLAGAYMGKGDDASARASLREALALKPGNPNAASNLARLEVEAGDFVEARRLYEEILRYNPDEIAPILFLSTLDQQEGDIEGAIARLEAAVKRHPKDVMLHFRLATLYNVTGQPSQVVSMTYWLAPEVARAGLMLDALGSAYFALGQYGAAIEVQQKLVEAEPNLPGGHFVLSRSYLASGEIALAKEELQRTLELNPEHKGARIMRVQLMRLERRIDEAVELLVALPPELAQTPQVLVEKGWIAIYAEDYAQAEQYFSEALERAPINDIVIQLALSRWQAGKKDAALDTYRAWLRKNPGDAKVLIHLANSNMQLGLDHAALKSFRKLESLNPENPVVLNNIAWLLRSKDTDEALAYAQRAVNLAPTWSAALDTLGSIHLELEEYDLARRSFGQALERSPGNPDIRYHMAMVAVRTGQSDEARDILQSILGDPALAFASRDDAEALLASLN